jgi:PAS domain S-box-containing protein
MRFRDLSIRNKLIVVIFTGSLTCASIVLTLLFFAELQGYQNKLKSDMLLNANLIGDYCAAPLDFGYAEDVEEIIQKTEHVPFISHAVVFDLSSNIVASYNRGDSPLAIIPGLTEKDVVRRDKHFHLIKPISLVDRKVGSIYIASDSTLKAKIYKQLEIAIFAFLGMFGISFILAVYLQGKISGPIIKLEEATVAVSKSNDYSLRVSKVSNDEVGSLFDGFNMMLEQISEKESERNVALNKLREKEDSLEEAQRIAKMGSWIWDLPTNWLSWSDNMCLIHGIEPSEFDGSFETFTSLIHPDDLDFVMSHIQEIIETKIESELFYRIINKEGDLKFVQGYQQLLLDEEGNVIRMNGTLHDITDRKEADDALKESEERFRSVIEQSNDAIYILYNEKFDLVNRRFTEMTGVKIEDTESPDFDFRDTMTPESKKMLAERDKKREQGLQPPGVFEFTIQHKDGQLHEVQASVTGIDYKDGKAILGILRDISIQKALEDQLRQAQKIESIGHLAGGIAHDFNNLLTPIMGNTELALMEMDPSAPLYEDLREIHETASRAGELTRQLLAFSRKQVLEMKSVDLNKLIENFRKILRRTIREDVKIEMKYGTALDHVRVDAHQIEQILMNLLVNAQDAMPSGGTITIETFVSDLDQGFSKTHTEVKPGRYVMLLVSDTGEGIDDEISQKIFDPFFTTKAIGKGTGLGLSTVHGIISQHGGHVWLKSELGVGTTFNLCLPAHKSEFATLRETDSRLDLYKGSGNILIAEDQEQVRRIASRILSSVGYTVYAAKDKQEAMVVINDDNISIDLLLTDVIMPETNGRDLYGILSNIQPDLKVLYMSGYTHEVIAKHGVLEDGISFIQKPLTVESLAKKVKSVMEQ